MVEHPGPGFLRDVDGGRIGHHLVRGVAENSAVEVFTAVVSRTRVPGGVGLPARPELRHDRRRIGQVTHGTARQVGVVTNQPAIRAGLSLNQAAEDVGVRLVERTGLAMVEDDRSALTDGVVHDGVGVLMGDDVRRSLELPPSPNTNSRLAGSQ